MERDVDSSLSLLQVRAAPVSPDHNAPVDLLSLGGQQTPCEFCQSECLATASAFAQQCAEKRGCDELEVGTYACLDRCKQRGRKRSQPCLEKCACSQEELADQEEKDVERAEAEEEIIDSAPSEQIADIIAEDDEDEQEGEDEQTEDGSDDEAEDGQEGEDELATEEDPFTLEDDAEEEDPAIREEYEGEAELRQEQPAPATDLYQRIRQSPCAFCQSECLVVEANFADRCVEKRECDALAAGGSDCHSRCKQRGKKRARPCLDACPCSERELQDQDKKAVEQADKDEKKSGKNQAAEIADIVSDSEGEEEGSD